MPSLRISLLAKQRIKSNKGGCPCLVINEIEADTLADLVPIWLEHHTSIGRFRPFIRSPGDSETSWRSGKNWIGNDLMGLDVDDGTTAQEIHSALVSYQINHTIMASTNHQKLKQDGTGIKDRFHVFIPFDVSVETDPNLYRLVASNLIKRMKWKFPAGPSKDKTRYFYRHSAMLHLYESGKPLVIGLYQKPLVNKRDPWAAFHKKHGIDTKSNEKKYGLLSFKWSSFYQSMLEGRLKVDGERYELSSQLIGAMIRCGVSLDEALGLFDEHSCYGTNFSRESVIKRFTEWSRETL